MTARERFQKVMNGDPTVEKGPVIEWASWWGKTTDLWIEEGMPAGMGRQELYDYFGLDRNLQYWPSIISPDCPKTETANAVPIIIEDEEDYERLKHYFYSEDVIEATVQQLVEKKAEIESGNSLLWYTLEGFFWFPRKLFGDEAHLYAFYDYPELYHQICEDLLAWQIKFVDRICQVAKPDFMTIAEDMSYNNGPMLSGDHFREFIMPYYKRLIPEIKKYGTKVFVDSDGDVSLMLPWLIESGVEGILPLERQAGVDLNAYREKYPEFMFIGGYDKICMLRGKEDIKKEFDRLLPVIESGRYIPSMDHQTPPGTTLENYRYYVELLHEYSKRACKSCK